MSLHLISFKTCPFVQRAVITLKHKNIDFDITYIDPATLPKVTARAQRLLALPEVRDSVVDEFEDLYIAALQKNASYSLNQLAA